MALAAHDGVLRQWVATTLTNHKSLRLRKRHAQNLAHRRRNRRAIEWPQNIRGLVSRILPRNSYPHCQDDQTNQPVEWVCQGQEGRRKAGKKKCANRRAKTLRSCGALARP